MKSPSPVIVPMSLRQRLGEDASEGLTVMFAAHHQFQTDRFERRLNEEIGELRLEIRQDRQKIAEAEREAVRDARSGGPAAEGESR